jgi:hypothetical protein
LETRAAPHKAFVPYYPTGTAYVIRRIGMARVVSIRPVSDNTPRRYTTHHPESKMAKLSVSGVVREVLTSDPEMPTDAVIRQAKAQGLRATDDQIRKSIHNQRAAVRVKVATAGVTPTPTAPKAAAAKAAPPKAAPAVSAPAATPAGVADLAGVLRNVALVNEIVGLCGGVESARQIAEAVRACGGPESFLELLELVASIRRGEAAA